MFLKFQWHQDVSNTTRVESSVDSVTRGSPFQSPPETGTGTGTTTETPARVHVPAPAGEQSPCLAPPQPTNGEWKLNKDFCEKGDMDCTVPEGSKLGLGYRLLYSCSTAYRVDGDSVVYCGRNGKWSKIPECVETKCSALSTEARIAHCTRYRKAVGCDLPMLPETEAQVSCRPGYKEDTEFLMRRRNMVTCKQGGEWHPRPLTCSPVCGQAVTHQRPFVIGGSNATVGDFPWHVSLYMQHWKDSTIKVFGCGATLIKTNFLLTAAHCVYDEGIGRTEDPRRIFFMTGNTFRDYDHEMHDPEIIRKGRVKNVYVPYTYTGLKGNYGSDIALLELEQPIPFSHILLPACLDNNDNSAPFLERGVYGKLAGFGRTATEETSPNLQTIEVPYISYHECKTSKYAVKNEVFITVDKFCAGYTNGSAVCEGDSGGGLVFRKNDLWYVMGIVSVGLGVNLDNGEQTCEKFSYTLYTRVSVHTEWILDTIFDAEQHHLQPWTPNFIVPHKPLSTETPPAPMPTDTAFTISSETKSTSCLAPPQPGNGQWKLDPFLCGGRLDCSIPGTRLDPGAQLVYTCNSGYKIRGNSEVYCRSGARWSALPVCIEVKCNPPSSVSTVATCTTESREPISCDYAVPVGTRAEVSCRPGYKGDTTITTSSKIVRCNSNGEWEPNLVSCSPECGKAITHQTPLIMNGNSAKTGDFPWHASIHEQINTTRGLEKRLLCGATLIQPNLLLTAAHCVYEQTDRITKDPKTLFVIMGNIFRDYDSPLHNPRIVERGEVKNIYRNCHYYGMEANYAADIALLELQKPFPLSEFLLPACLDIVGSSVQVLDSGSYGKIAGFGRTATGFSSSILQTITVPYVPYSECKASQGAERNEVFDGTDKFCAGYTNGSALCNGDSGGGLVFEKNELWFVFGIASIPLRVSYEAGNRDCNGNTYTLYTKVSKYIPWIQDVILQLKAYKSYPSCDSEAL